MVRDLRRLPPTSNSTEGTLSRVHPVTSRAPEAQLRRLEEILAAGTRLFEERGFGRTTMDDIAAAAGITKRTLYRYVQTKQDFLLMIHEQFLDAAEQLLPENTSATLTQQFSDFVRAYCTVIVHHQKAVRVFFEEEYNLSDAARDKVVARRDDFEGRLRTLLRAGQESGEFRAFDVGVVSAGIFGALAGVYQWYTPRGPLSVTDLAETLSDLLTDGLLVPPATRSTAAFPGLDLDTPPAANGHGSTPSAVVEAAVHLFATRGYTETNTRAIAERAQVTKSALFYYIGAKEDLLYSIHREFGATTLRGLAKDLAEPADSFEAAARRVVRGHAEVIGNEPERVRIFSDQLRYLGPERQSEVERLRGRYVDGLATMIAAGRDAGTFRAYDARVVALTALSMLNWMSRWYDPRGRRDATQIGEEYARVLLGGIAAHTP